MQTPKLLWTPSDAFINESNLAKYAAWLRHEQGITFDNYDEIWRWSVQDIERFWESIWDYFEVISHSPYKRVLDNSKMPGVNWFEGATLNYAEHVFAKKQPNKPAIIYKTEGCDACEMSWDELETRTASLAAIFQEWGLQAGDSVVGFLPNIPAASIAFLAACSQGIIWSSCSPDFGTESIVDRFKQIKPKVLIACDGYTYNGKPYSKVKVVQELKAAIPSLEKVIVVPFLAHEELPNEPAYHTWESVTSNTAQLSFEALPFSHPIWVLYSSGTTGEPKAITHSHGGCLLEHLKYIHFHNDAKPGERFFWFSTTGWMMWNYVHASWLASCTVVLYEGGAGYPKMNTLWKYAADIKLNHFGTSAPFIVACMKRELHPSENFDLSALRSIGSTGAPLPPAGFDWIYEKVKKDIWLTSMSGGTDVCTAFVGGVPLEPVYEGEIQGRALGCDLHAWDEDANPVLNEVGEMVIRQPMPSMPIYFWNDTDMKRYKNSYFETYKDVWRHGDWVEITDRGSLVIYGRSDATLNRQGVRIGTAEVYRAVDSVHGIKDSLVINLELADGKHFMPLFVVMEEGEKLTADKIKEIKLALKTQYSPRHVPDELIEVSDLPYTISGKKMEAPVKKLLLGLREPNEGAMKNPSSLAFFRQYKNYIKQL